MDLLSIVVPCFNERRTLEGCISRLLALDGHDGLTLDIIIVNDASTDGSGDIADRLSADHPQVRTFHQAVNSGKGAALRTGFQQARGDYVAIQDADLEYDPTELPALVRLIRDDLADVVFGSRFLASEAHRVLYFWHSLGNRLLTLLSNIMTDLNLTDMETCYKVFRREIVEQIDIQENRFGVEPELTAKVARLRCRVYEKGISYHGRTYSEGKKINWKDGLRAVYCIVRYNAPHAPLPIQFLIYLGIGGTAAVLNLILFLGLFSVGLPVAIAAPLAFIAAAALNYRLCTAFLFERARRSVRQEVGLYSSLVLSVAVVDALITWSAIKAGMTPVSAKLLATAIALLLNFVGRKYFLFQRFQSRDWAASRSSQSSSASSEKWGSPMHSSSTHSGSTHSSETALTSGFSIDSTVTSVPSMDTKVTSAPSMDSNVTSAPSLDSKVTSAAPVEST